MSKLTEDPLYRDLAKLRRSPRLGKIFLLYEEQNRGVLKENSRSLQGKIWSKYLSAYENERADRMSPLLFIKDVLSDPLDNGHYSSAILATRLMVSLLNFAVAIGVLKTNPLATIWNLPLLKKADRLSKAVTAHRPCFAYDTAKSQLKSLIKKFSSECLRRQFLLQISLRTLLRPAEVVSLKISDLDCAKHQITARNTKTRTEFIIPTDAKLEEILINAHRLYGSEYSGYILSGYRNPKDHLSAQTMNRALKDCGYQGCLCAHGIRTLGRNFFSAHTKEVPPYISEAILQHVPSKVERAYRRDDDYLMQRRLAMRLWWDYLNALMP